MGGEYSVFSKAAKLTVQYDPVDEPVAAQVGYQGYSINGY